MRASEAWLTRRHGTPSRFGPPDGLWGLAGVAAEGNSPDATALVRFDVPEGGATLNVDALGWERGGPLRVRVNEEEPRIINTRRGHAGLIRERFELPAGEVRIGIRVEGNRPVRLLGLDIEHHASGVIYDSLGINGHRGNAWLRWNQPLLQAQLEDRKPDLVVVAYGANEALDSDLTPQRFGHALNLTLDRVRAAAPEASCLVVAPVAQCHNPALDEIVRIQRLLAPRHGCAYWDTSAVSGGPGSLCEWTRAGGLVSRDGLHLRPEGYTLIGDKLADVLLDEAAH